MYRADRSRRIMALAALVALSFGLFALWPGLDLWVARLFFDPQGAFTAFDTGLPNLIRLAIWRASELLLALAIAATIIGLWTKAPVLQVPRQVWTYVLLLYLLAPGILVDVVVKRIWGRARPADVTEFGGNLLFTPPHQLAHQCARNCSFVAGEMAGSMALAISLFLILRQFRTRLHMTQYRVAQILIFAVPLYSGFQRIAGGRHFLSDVIFAGLLVLFVAEILRPLVLRHHSA
jgi:lipid A 4'-phosphatase